MSIKICLLVLQRVSSVSGSVYEGAPAAAAPAPAATSAPRRRGPPASSAARADGGALVAGELGERGVHLVGDALVLLLLVDQLVCGRRGDGGQQSRQPREDGSTEHGHLPLPHPGPGRRPSWLGHAQQRPGGGSKRMVLAEAGRGPGAGPHAAGGQVGLVGRHLGEGGVQLVRDRLELLLFVHKVVCKAAGGRLGGVAAAGRSACTRTHGQSPAIEQLSSVNTSH